MKNKFKWLTAIPAIAAITPIAYISSCKSDNWVEPIDLITIGEDPYDPQIERPEMDDWQDASSVTELYIDKVKEDPSLFQRDMIYAASLRRDELKDQFYNLKYQVGCSKPSFGKTFVSQTQYKDTEYNTISFRQKFVITYTRTMGNTNIEQEITVNVDYNDVIFMAYIPQFETKGDDTIWAIGFGNDTYESESLWLHYNNQNPWSIKFSISAISTKTIHDEEGKQPDIVIHNSDYYSGNIDTGTKLLKLLEIQNRMLQKSTEYAVVLQLMFLIYSQRSESYLLSKIQNKPEIGIYQQLSGVQSGSKDINVEGLRLTIPKSEMGNDATISIFSTKDIVARENTSYTTDPNILYILKDTVLQKSSKQPKGNTSINYSLPCKLNELFTQVGSHSFNMPSAVLPVIITYADRPGVEIKCDINIHYGLISVEYGVN